MVAAVVVGLGGCHSAGPPTTYVGHGGTMPPNTILLSTMMNDLSSEPGFTEKLLSALAGESKTGAAIMSPKMVHALRTTIRGRWWLALDRFPGWGMADINPVVDLSGKIDRAVANVHPRPLSEFIDVGEYRLDKAGTVDLDKHSTNPGFSTDGLVAPLSDEVVRGDGPNPALAPMHSESMRLAEVLNRLSTNAPQSTDGVPTKFIAQLSGHRAQSPAALISALMESGHTVEVADARYFANFGHLHYAGKDVMMPFWVSAEVLVPGTDRYLRVPVSHAEYEWRIRGPQINADVAFYFGIDGKAEFRTMDQLDQAWVMGRHAHEYRGADAVEVTRLTGQLVLAYAHLHQAHPTLAFGGYYALGVCQDGIAAIEQKMTGKATLFPNTADMTLFDDARDAEINGMLAAIAKDRDGKPPQMDRVFGSLPTTDLAVVSIPGLAEDLESVHDGWQRGTLRYRRTPVWETRLVWAGGAALALALLWALLRLIKRKHPVH